MSRLSTLVEDRKHGLRPLRSIGFVPGLVFLTSLILTLSLRSHRLSRSRDPEPGWVSRVLPKILLHYGPVLLLRSVSIILGFIP